ncbi:uncharacterized protein C20orf96 homolog [Perognathus longimembris pacificus]|uniref:uncharacterized protein C20orf96 homolog n=1 Tax=Perognathus longimembris pacificus TaxID=214514 RepID=UPI002019923B|nr:uncharacterized protein C20orf96 homolog [Perognathus longimembris pacificus]
MANLSRANSRSGTLSTIHRFQHSNQKLKQWILPPLHRTVSHSKSKMKSSVKPSKIAMLSTSQLMTLSETQGREQLHTGMIQARLRLMRSMVRSQRASLKELCNHEAFLSKLNQDLVKTIQDMEDATALNVRALLQQQHVLGTVIGILEYSNKKRVQELSSELQEWEEKEEHKMSSLEQEVQRLNDEISATHEEVNFLSTYMDHEYPVKSVQIADHMRQLQQAKDQQQDELDNLNEMRKMILDSLCNVIREKQKEMLKSLMTKIQQPFEKRLQHKTLNSQNMQRHMAFLKDFIEEMKKEISILADEVKEPESQVLDPREIVFEDVLLRRPRCSPDMAVTLNIPMEDLLF